MTPSAATPTRRPSPMKPWMSRLNVTEPAVTSSHAPARSTPPPSRCQEGRLEAAWPPRPGRPRARGRSRRWSGRRGRGRRRSSVLCEVEIPAISSGVVSERIPITVSVDGLPGLGVAYLDRDRLERALVEVEAAEPEVGGHGEVEVVAPRDDRAVDHGEIRLRRDRVPDVARGAVALGDLAQVEASCARGRRRRARGRRTARAGVRCPSGSPRSAGTTATPRRRCPRPRSPGATATARSMSVMGVVPPVLARTSNPPPKVSRPADGVHERAVRGHAGHEREDDEREHRERRAGPEAVGAAGRPSRS